MSENHEKISKDIENESFESDNQTAGLSGNASIEESVSGEIVSETDKLKNELADLDDKHKRLYSEFVNYKNRTTRERIDLLRSAGSEIIVALLPVLDDFERASKFATSPEESKGLELIHSKIKGILESKGLKKMESIGKEFDSDLHEAITNAPAPSEDMKGKVLDEAECGYYLNEKVIRFAKVIVAN